MINTENAERLYLAAIHLPLFKHVGILFERNENGNEEYQFASNCALGSRCLLY